MDEFTPIYVMIAVASIFLVSLVCFAFYDQFASPTDSFTGNLIDVEYSQSGVGSPDIMVFYFEDGTILRFVYSLAEVHLGNCTVMYRGSDYSKHLVDIQYN